MTCQLVRKGKGAKYPLQHEAIVWQNPWAASLDIVLTVLFTFTCRLYVTSALYKSLNFTFYREIKEYFENSYDLYESLFRGIKGELHNDEQVLRYRPTNNGMYCASGNCKLKKFRKFPIATVYFG